MPPDAQTSQLLTQKAYAVSRGHDPALLTRWKKRGRVVMVGRLVDAPATDEKLKATMDERRVGVVRTKTRQGQGVGSDIDEIRKQRARRERAEADRAEQRARVGSGNFVDRQGVARAIGDVGSVVNQHFESFESRAGTAIASEFGLAPRAVIARLEDQVRDLRQAIADAIRQLATKYPEPGIDTEGQK